ncbi:MAG: ABC transporter ATP-binding protein/permease [Victivallaceae bacterium]|nr:ABC transporter ATP-binding protein/permease [Victivallaceae bacterium]
MKSNHFWYEFAVFRQLWFLTKIYFRRQKKLLAVTLLLGFFAETLAMAMPQLTGNLAGTIGEWHTFRRAALLFLGVGVVQFLFAVVNDVLDRLLKDRLDRDAFCFTHEAILSLDPDCFKENSGGENLLNLNAGRGVAATILELIAFPLYYGGGLTVGLLFLFDALDNIHLPLWLTLLLVGGMAVQPFLTWYFGKLIARAYTKVRESCKEINDETLNDLHAPVELHLMDALKRRMQAMFKIQHQLALRMDKAMLLHIASRYSMSLLILLFQFAIVVSVLCHYDAQSPVVRDLVAAILLIPLMFNHLNKLQQMYNNIKDQEPYIRKIVDLFRRKSRLPDGEKSFPAGNLPSVELRDVSFAYDAGQNVLKHITFFLAPGKCGALVSPSGGGKSTIFKLLCRLYLPQSGNIRVAGKDVFAIRESDYRARCVMISQFPLFIQGTIRDNFHLQCPGASDAEITAACQKFRLPQLLDVKPETIADHKLTLGADNLSGGQRKLLALSRASLMKPELLLIDEPSAGIDGSMIQSHLLPALRALKGSMTMILIDHNLNFISSIADDVFLLEGGNIAESGACRKLLTAPQSRFARLVAEWNIAHPQK